MFNCHSKLSSYLTYAEKREENDGEQNGGGGVGKRKKWGIGSGLVVTWQKKAGEGVGILYYHYIQSLYYG